MSEGKILTAQSENWSRRVTAWLRFSAKKVLMKFPLLHFLSRQIVLPLSVFFFFFFFAGPAQAQQTCTYTVQMFDSFGDGWNGGVLTVVSNGVTTTHALTTGASGSSAFQVVNGTPVVLSWQPGSFATEVSFNLVNPDGVVLYSSPNPIPAGEVFSTTGFCPNCPAPNPNLTIINQITDTSAFVNWFSVPVASSYIVEYGPHGFPLGTGIVLEANVSNSTLTGLNPGVDYDVYIASFCGEDSVSIYIGPYSFQTTYTPPGATGVTCDYTLNLFDSFGDGWSGGQLTVTQNGVSTSFTLVTGTSGSFTFTAQSNVPLYFSFTAGLWSYEVSYQIVDPNGLVIFEDGPGPQTGNVFSTIACPSCPGPVNAWMADVNANNARVAWTKTPGTTGNYIVEYGPMGFTLGAGTVVNVVGGLSTADITGLEENTWYNAYVTLDCGTEFSKPVGPLMFKTLWLKDVGVSGIITPNASEQCNLSSHETVTVLLTNFGQLPQTLFEFFFAVNGQVAPIPVPQDGLFTGVLGNDSTQVIQFETTWDFSEPGYYTIEAWTVMQGDSNPANDTFRIQVQTAFPKPVQEDFEDNVVQEGWTHNGFIYAPLSHNNPTYVLSRNLYSGVQNFTLTTNRLGPVFAGDSLYFDYRYVNWFDGTIPTVLGPNDKLELQISDDCGETYQTVLTMDSASHVVSTDFARKVFLLDGFSGKAINVRISATWGAGDYWFDLDNINVTGCPGNLAMLSTIKGSAEGSSTGSISLNPTVGTAPYTFLWDTGDTTAFVQNLPPGVYEVTVSDANGCTDSRVYEVGILVAADEVAGVEAISLYPNPTTGRAFLDLVLTEAMEVQVRVFSMSGRLVSDSGLLVGRELREELDLGNQPPGMYVLQVIANGTPHHAKLMVTR